MSKWRKNYTSQYKRKLDEQLGFFFSLVLNGILFVIYITVGSNSFKQAPLGEYTELIVLGFPWVINIAILILALIFRPAYATGHVYLLALTLFVPIILGIVLVGSCIVSIPFGLLLSLLGDEAMVLYLPCLGLIFLGSLAFVWQKVLYSMIVDWWRDYGLPDD